MAEKYASGGIPITIGTPKAVEIAVRVIRARLTGFLFDSNKCFLLPGAMKGIRRLKELYGRFASPAVLVVGHTDRVGTPDYNLTLSEERAQSIAAFLQDRVDDWLAWYTGKPAGKQWGYREDELMLSALPEGQPPFSAENDPVRAFQAWSNQSFGTTLVVDGVAGPKTRRELVTRYMALDDTTLPAGAVIQTHGCGEAHRDLETADEVDEQQNRRVEVFLFDGLIAPPPRRPCPPPDGCPEHAQWLAQVSETIDVSHDAPIDTDEPIDITVRAANAAAELVVKDGDTEALRVSGLDQGEGRRRFRIEGLDASKLYRVEVVDPAEGILAAWTLRPGEFHRAMKSGDVDRINVAFAIAPR